MRVRVSDQALLHDLLQYLRQAGYIAEQAGPDTLDVFVTLIPKERQARMKLSVDLAAWRIRNPGVETKVLTFPPRWGD